MVDAVKPDPWPLAQPAQEWPLPPKPPSPWDNMPKDGPPMAEETPLP